jgi:ssDNA-binding Zn-finger/Zn-ribbon topoisomerase 1
MEERAQEGERNTCPRCEGDLQTSREFTRWGRKISVLLCPDCQYTRRAATVESQQ